jgi:hypothetical protein
MEAEDTSVVHQKKGEEIPDLYAVLLTIIYEQPISGLIDIELLLRAPKMEFRPGSMLRSADIKFEM